MKMNKLFFKSVTGSLKNTENKLFSLSFKNIFTKNNFSLLCASSWRSKYSTNTNSCKCFSTETEDTHSDFKPKVKQEINDENVMRVIDEWVKNNDVVLFMKGTREMPRCGFSNYVVQILNFYKIKNVKVINILEGQALREAVKQYSNWPTYPQLYVKGNLIGGCDIIKEMHENGTFKEMVEREGLNQEVSK